MNCSTPSLPVHHQLPEFTQTVMPSSHLILCHPLFLLPSIFPSIRVFSSELALHIRWPKYWRFSISLSNEYSGLIFFRFDWFDLLVVQGTHKRVFSNTAVQKHQFFSRTLEWAAIFFCRGSSNKGIEFVCLLRGRHIFYHWATWEALTWPCCCCCC